MLIWGRNNNHLFRHNHKKSYSLPQKIPIAHSIIKIAAGYDYLLLQHSQSSSLCCYYQNAFYRLNKLQNVLDFATTDNMIVIVSSDGTALISEFNAQKIMTEELSTNKIMTNQHIQNVFMNNGDIFLVAKSQNIYHLKRNQWYETKTFSDPTLVKGLQSQNIKIIAPGVYYNYFLTKDGQLWQSTKKQPNKAISCKISKRFISIAAANYFLGISQSGRLYIWGQYLDNLYQNLTEFGKLSQTFKRISLSSQNGFAITSSGQAWVWGKNANGQLGVSDYQPRTKPFPLITLQKQTVTDIFVGQGYTVGLIQTLSNTKKSTNQLTELNKDKNAQKIRHKKFFTRDDSSLSISQHKSARKTKENILKPIRTEMLREDSSKKSKKNRGQDKQNLKLNLKCKSPLNSYKSVSYNKSGSSHSYKSPAEQPKAQKCIWNVCNDRAKRQIKQKELRNLSSSKGKAISLVKQLEQQNLKLKKIISQKDVIIQDITSKIKMLEDAIEQYQKNLTARDHLMEDYQRRQTQYQLHIDQLQKSVDTLIKGKSQHQNVEDYPCVLYKNLKNQFNSQKQQYLNKIRVYEEELKAQREQYKCKIKQLEGQVISYRSRIQMNYQQNSQSQGFGQKSRVKNKSDIQNLPASQKQQDRVKMDIMISKIQQNKIRIGRSANKLIEMLDK